MTDSDSFSSLMALVDNHLSKTSMQASSSANVEGGFPKLSLPSLSGGTNETVSETRIFMSPGQRLPLPTLSLTDSPIQEVLAQQVNNMLKAKERKKKQEEELAQLAKERQKIIEEEKKRKAQEENDVIDLVKAVKESMNFMDSNFTQKEEPMSSSSSFESLFEPKFIDCDEPERIKTPEPLLPCRTDMSFILKQKVRRGKCSPFGKVLSSRLKPVAAPYLMENIPTNIIHFDFSTKSPCDLMKEKLRKPQMSQNHTFDIFSIFPDMEK